VSTLKDNDATEGKVRDGRDRERFPSAPYFMLRPRPSPSPQWSCYRNDVTAQLQVYAVCAGCLTPIEDWRKRLLPVAHGELFLTERGELALLVDNDDTCGACGGAEAEIRVEQDPDQPRSRFPSVAVLVELLRRDNTGRPRWRAVLAFPPDKAPRALAAFALHDVRARHDGAGLVYVELRPSDAPKIAECASALGGEYLPPKNRTS
jgi:hypothetical protein